METAVMVAILASCFVVILCAHEYGHYKVAKMCGIAVPVFSLGFGPKLFKWTKNDTEFSIKLLPFGGYCGFNDEDVENLPRIKQIAILAAGCFNNLLTGFIPLAIAGIIYKINPFVASGKMIAEVFKGLGEIFNVSFSDVQGPAGTLIAISSETVGMDINFKFKVVLAFMSLLSYSVMIFNMLPIPALDGGQIAIAVLDGISEKLRGRGLNKRVVSTVNTFFLAVFLTLTAFVMLSDFF